MSKFKQEHLDFVYAKSKNLIDKFGYTPYFNQKQKDAKIIEGFIEKHNLENLKKAIYNEK